MTNAAVPAGSSPARVEGTPGEHRKGSKKSKIPLDIASYKLYYVNLEIARQRATRPLCTRGAGSDLLPF